MAREFAITAATPSLTVGPSGNGEVAFTVSNMTGARVRARASLRVDDGAVPAWVKLRGDPVRELQPDSTEVFLVDVQVPPGTPRGSHRFTLLVVDVLNPDERYVVGPMVALEVPATAPVPRKDRRWLYALVAGLVVILGGTLAAFLALRDEGTGGSGPPPPPPPPATPVEARLGENCTALPCAAGLLCGAARVCLGEAGFTGCASGKQCTTGFCAQGVCTACGAPGRVCDERCVNIERDPENCGGCGFKCVLDSRCDRGRCLRQSVTHSPTRNPSVTPVPREPRPTSPSPTTRPPPTTRQNTTSPTR